MRCCLLLTTLLLATAGCKSGTPAPATPAPTSSEAPPAAVPGSFTWSDETLGPLHLGMDVEAVTAALGEPDDRTEAVEEGATGEWVSLWLFPDAGVSLQMSATAPDQPSTVRAISIEQPSQLRTSRGIGLGANHAQVEAAYADYVYAEGEERAANDDPGEYIVGSEYGGITFGFDGEGGVVYIAIGSNAE